MSNGQNSWGVRYSHITWFERLLKGHENIADCRRRDDIVFDVRRRDQQDDLSLLCLNEYVMGFTLVQRALAEFEGLNIIYIGGGWCGYTQEAKEFCIGKRIGLYVTNEVSGALWKEDFWAYHQRDKEGDPVYFYRTARN